MTRDSEQLDSARLSKGARETASPMKRLLVSLAIVPLSAACALSHSVSDQEAQRRMLDLLMPSRIQIVEPFTQVKAVDEEGRPNTVELLIQAVNSLDDPGLMIVGRIRVELYEFMPASADERGRLLEHWDVDLSTVKQQKLYWNQLTQMYEFQLGLDPEQIPRAPKYVLAVVYCSPLGGHLSDEYVLSLQDVRSSPTTRIGRP